MSKLNFDSVARQTLKIKQISQSIIFGSVKHSGYLPLIRAATHGVITTKTSWLLASRDRIVVSTLRCGRNNPGSNLGHGRLIFHFKRHFAIDRRS